MRTTTSLLPLLALADRAADDARVARQYAAFPYNHNVLTEWTDAAKLFTPEVRQIAHYSWHNTIPPHINVLIVGGGSGAQAAIFAKELEALNIRGTVTHLEPSPTAIRIARSFVARHNLTHRVDFIQRTIEAYARDTPPSTFDIISCHGVLHHLADPPTVLRSLNTLLTPRGAIDLLVYGKEGRSSLYSAQAALRLMLPTDEILTDAERLQELRNFTAIWPATSSIRDPSNMWSDFLRGANVSDNELFDRHLHPRDVAYSVPDLAALATSAGLRILSLRPSAEYDPDMVVFKDDASRASYAARRVRGRPLMERAEFAELITSRPYLQRLILVDADNDYLPFPSFDQRCGFRMS